MNNNGPPGNCYKVPNKHIIEHVLKGQNRRFIVVLVVALPTQMNMFHRSYDSYHELLHINNIILLPMPES